MEFVTQINVILPPRQKYDDHDRRVPFTVAGILLSSFNVLYNGN